MELEKTAVFVSEEMQREREHNAQISERYRMLQNAIEDQFATPTKNTAYQATATYIPSQTTFAPTFTAPTQSVEQRPNVTEYVRTGVSDSALFTAEKFDRFQVAEQNNAPAYVGDTVGVQETVAVEESYSISAFAKVLMSVFTVAVVGMLALACINTQTIKTKSIHLQNLEEKRQELMEKNEEIQRRIEEARSDEAIREYAISQGMIQNGQ